MKKIITLSILLVGTTLLSGCSLKQNRLTSPSSLAQEQESSDGSTRKSYTNIQHGYSFQYPHTGWFVYADPEEDVTRADVVSISVVNVQDRNHLIEVSTQDLQSKLDEAVEMYSSATSYNKTDILFEGMRAVQLTYTTVIEDRKISEGKAIIFSKDGKTYYLDGTTKDYEKNDVNRGIFNEILASFRFVE